MGTLHNKSTGSSLARFNDLALREGDLIKVTYVNDVMPYVSKLECSHNRENKNPLVPIIENCPVCGSKLVVSDSGKTLICPNFECEGRSIQRMANMFQKMNIKGFAEAAVRALNIKHIHELEGLDKDQLISKLGEADGRAFYKVMQSFLKEKWPDYIIMGSLGFTNIARKKWQAILEYYTISELYGLCLNQSGNKLYTILLEHVPPAAAQVIVDEFVFFREDIQYILDNFNIVNTKNDIRNPLSDVHIRFSGCRNLNLTQLLSSQGVDIDDCAVTKKTDLVLVPYQGFNSTKTAKAERYGIPMVALADFEKNPKMYIDQIVSTK
jgi:NAD-dependent DNA ligase